MIAEECDLLERNAGPANIESLKAARKLFDRLSTSSTFEEFLTIPAYAQLA
ncbi:MAG: hypothetical protein ACREJX_19460 [Polyangiaceae bacterium]